MVPKQKWEHSALFAHLKTAQSLEMEGKIRKITQSVSGRIDETERSYHQSKSRTRPIPIIPYRFHLPESDSCACGEVGDPIHYATSCPLTLSWCIRKPSPVVPKSS
ncbi:hypothetical protein AVEN_30829-1 [Araneus ventricosus]|uniref:Uncharacterized protein n=1 Tax=Araneus ventricosus TaxID=182803 RepID=A0A4Y2KN74_ARAVE|nr:hypothetical protein AVEN_30829-1 [Araneus ventricosus]